MDICSSKREYDTVQCPVKDTVSDRRNLGIFKNVGSHRYFFYEIALRQDVSKRFYNLTKVNLKLKYLKKVIFS